MVQQRKNMSVPEASVFLNRKDIEYFRFEEDFVEANMRCIPMIVRFKMDLAGIKLKLSEWVKLSTDEKLSLALVRATTAKEINAYKQMLMEMLLSHTGLSGTAMEINADPAWARQDKIPDQIISQLEIRQKKISISQWKKLSDLQRFALVKLAGESHENKNFPKAIVEFGLC